MRVPLPAAMITTLNAVMSFILCLPRIIGQALLWAGLCLLVGCSSVRVGYNQSDTLVYWWVDRYVDLTAEQKPFVKTALLDLKQWHRQEQLPEYMALLERLRAAAQRDITAQEVCTVAHEVKDSYARLLRQIEPAATQLVTQLDAAQMRQLRKRYDKTNEEWREEWLNGDADQRLKYRVKQAQGRLEEFYGRLDTSQRQMLVQWLSTSGYDPSLAYAERLRRQADSVQTFEQIQQAGASAAAANALLLRAWIERAFDSPQTAYRAYNQQLWLQNCAGFAKLHNRTTPEQRQALVQTLMRYENDFRSLMKP